MIQTGHISSGEQSFNSVKGGGRNFQFEEAAHPEPGFQSPSTQPVEKNVDCILECVNSDTSFSRKTLHTFSSITGSSFMRISSFLRVLILSLFQEKIVESDSFTVVS